MDSLENLPNLFLNENYIKEIKGLGNLNKLEVLGISGNPLNADVLKQLGGLSEDGSAKKPLKFVKYCKKH
jgi:Leucine-rich repeat (LRR) protein